METIERLQCLAEDHTPPDIERALTDVMAVGKKRRARSRRRIAVMIVGAGLISLSLAFAGVRGAAQDVWAELEIRSIGVTPAISSSLPPELLMPNVFPLGPTQPSKVMSRAEAERFVEFAIQIPHTSLLPYQPVFSVKEQSSVARGIDAQSIDNALTRLGRESIELPAGLNGKTVAVRFPKSVTVSFGRCAQLIGPWHACAFLQESRAPTLVMPAGIADETMTVFSLRLLGLSAPDARALARRHVLFFPPENYARHKTVQVKGHAALLVISKPDAHSEVAYNLSWVADGIAYSLFGRDPDTAITVAESIH